VPFWISKSDGTGATMVGEVALSDSVDMDGPSWSRDLFLVDDFVVVDAEEGKLYQLPGIDGTTAKGSLWSPAGDRIAYLAPQSPPEDGSQLMIWNADDQTAEIVASTTAFANSSPAWSENELFLGATVESGQLTDNVFLAGIDGRSRLLDDIDGGLTAIGNDGWFLVVQRGGGNRWVGYDLDGGQIELFDNTTTNLVSGRGYVAACNRNSGQIEVKAANGTSLATLQATPDCIMKWTWSGRYLAAWDGEGAVHVLQAGEREPIKITLPDTLPPVLILSNMRHGEGFGIQCEEEQGTWIYLEDGVFKLASPEGFDALSLSAADFAGFVKSL
jgi:hypothetical protein